MASLHFYRYFLKRNGENTDYNLIHLIDYIYRVLNIQHKTIRFNNHWYSLNRCFIPSHYHSIRFFQICKSVNNAYMGHLETGLKSLKLSPIRNSLYGYISCLVVPFYHLLITYQPQNSPSINEVSRYLMTYIDTKNPWTNFDLNISPIVYNLRLNELTPEYKIKDIYISFNLGNLSNHRSKNSLYGVLNDIYKYSSGNNINKDYVISLRLKNNVRKHYINYALVSNLVRLVLDEHNNIIKLSLNVKGPNDHRFKKIGINRKNTGNILVPFTMNNNYNSYYIYSKMLNYYINGNLPKEVACFISENLLNSYTNFKLHFINNPKNDFYNLKEFNHNKQ